MPSKCLRNLLIIFTVLIISGCGSSNSNDNEDTEEGSEENGEVSEEVEPATPEAGFSAISLTASIDNVQPMTGLVFWTENHAALGHLGDSVQLEFSYMLYSDIVQQVGDYNWQVVEDVLNDVASSGHQAILRFRYTYPGYTEVSVPESIANLAGYNIMIDEVESQDTFLPDWSNSALQNFTLQFYADFAARYDGDPRLAMLQVGFSGDRL